MQPTADVTVGVWVEGPDGRRDMDVRVRTVVDGQPYLTLIECKDWYARVGIEVVDELVSKCEDLDANAAAIYAKSGFTVDAQRKARRKGIALAIPMRHRDGSLRLRLFRRVVARTVSVDRWQVVFFTSSDVELPESIDPLNVRFQGAPIVNWLHVVSNTILDRVTKKSRFQAEYAFKGAHEFEINGESYPLTGVVTTFDCSAPCVAQDVEESVSFGEYDFLRGRVIVPDKQAWFLGPFDKQAWQTVPCPEPISEAVLEPGTFRVDLILRTPVPTVEPQIVPGIDDLVAESSISEIDQLSG